MSNHWQIPDTPEYTTLRALAEGASEDDYRVLNGLRYKITPEELTVLSRAIERYAERQSELTEEKVKKLCNTQKKQQSQR